VQQVNRLNQVFKTSAEPVQLPNNQGITRPAKFNSIHQTFTVVTGFARLVGEYFLESGLFQRVGLQLQILIDGRNSGISYFH
jgi:hypothetical protein